VPVEFLGIAATNDVFPVQVPRPRLPVVRDEVAKRDRAVAW
jgi:hypothetical protein